MADRIRVLTIIDSLGIGGAQALLPTFLRHVDRDLFEVGILSLNAHSRNHIHEAIAAEQVPCVEWKAARLLNIRRIRSIARVINEQQVDIVHSHLIYSNVQASIAATMTRRPIVATLHNVHEFSPLIKRKVETGVLRAARARALAVSGGVERSFGGPLGLRAAQMTVVPNAIDLDRFQQIDPSDVVKTRQELLDGAVGPLIVGVGRVTTPKGFADLVRAAAFVHARYPNVRFAIAGRPADGHAEVVAEIERLGMGDIVRLVGQRSDVPQMLAAADVYASPSLSEGAPVTHLEAMAAGAAVVATGVGGVPEIIHDGENGLLVPPSQPQQLADALMRLIADREMRDRLACRGRESVQAYGAETWVQRIEDEYLQLLGRTRQ